MPSIFEEQSKMIIHCPYAEMTSAQLAAAPGGYFTILTARIRITKLDILNALDEEVQIYLVNPADTGKTKQPWAKIGVNEGFSMESELSPQFYIPAGTQIMIAHTGAAPTSGKLKLTHWGN
jgi:hypothetical protein